MEIVSLNPDSTNAFTIADDLKWQSKIKALKDGKKVKISNFALAALRFI